MQSTNSDDRHLVVQKARYAAAANDRYKYVKVYLRDQEPLQISADNGIKLMAYLTGEPQGKHVELTPILGSPTVVLITDIVKVQPIGRGDRSGNY